MISSVVPVSPSLGKFSVTLFVKASAFVSVMASVESVTLNPHSYAKRAVDSTPMLVETPPMTTWVTPRFFR